MDENKIPSLLSNDTYLSDEYGVFALCQIGNLPPHAFLLFEYLTSSTSSPGARDRVIKRLDFRPDGLVNSIIGRSKITQADVTTANLTKLKIGPFWLLKIENVLKVPGFKNSYQSTVNGNADANEVRIDDIDIEVYSSAGNSVRPLLRLFRKKVENCMTFSRGYIIKYRRDLGITETERELDKMMNLKWVPIQLPSLLVPIYKKHQCKRDK